MDFHQQKHRVFPYPGTQGEGSGEVKPSSLQLVFAGKVLSHYCQFAFVRNVNLCYLTTLFIHGADLRYPNEPIIGASVLP